jgi:hypothetical protein
MRIFSEQCGATLSMVSASLPSLILTLKLWPVQAANSDGSEGKISSEKISSLALLLSTEYLNVENMHLRGSFIFKIETLSVILSNRYWIIVVQYQAGGWVMEGEFLGCVAVFHFELRRQNFSWDNGCHCHMYYTHGTLLNVRCWMCLYAVLVPYRDAREMQGCRNVDVGCVRINPYNILLLPHRTAHKGI